MKKYRLLPDDWSPKEIGTLVYVADGDRILLIEKLRGHGAGLINAPGGRLERGETICFLAFPDNPMKRIRFGAIGQRYLMSRCGTTTNFGYRIS